MNKMQSKKNNLWILLLGGTALASYLYMSNKKRLKRTNALDQEEEEAVKLLLPSFTNASQLARSLKNISQHNQLMLYGLYKQARNGNARDNTSNFAMGAFNLIARKKYEAWTKFHDMPRHFAMMKYIEVIEHFMTRDSVEIESTADGGFDLVEEMMNENDIVYENEDEVIEFSDEENDQQTERSNSFDLGSNDVSIGIKQSTLGGRVRASDDYEDGFEPSERNSVMFAASVNDIKLMEKALTLSDDVDERDDNGQCALHIAADKGHVECVKLLLDAGSDPNAVDFEGISVLEAAVIGGSIEVCKILLDAGADPDHEDADGDTPRTCAEDDSDEEIQTLLRQAKPLESLEKSFSSMGTEASQYSC
jgi:acyl-CoA-binding protein